MGGFDCEGIFISAKGHDREVSQAYLRQSLEKLPKPLAVFTTFDTVGERCLKACEKWAVLVVNSKTPFVSMSIN